jgi:hypothetical protein
MSKFQRVMAARRMKFLWLAALLLAVTLGQRAGLAAETRFALVIGNDEYKSAKLATPANDAGLIASVLTAAGFTVTGARNLDQAALRESVREFLGQVAAAGPDAVAVIYLAGFGVQFAGENYYVPVDADLTRDVDVPLQAVRISDFAQPLATLPARVKIVILDAARTCATSRWAAIRALKMPMPRRSRSTRSTATSNSWRSIRAADTRGASPPWWRYAAKRSSGGIVCSTTRRRLTGRICGAIQTARTYGTRGAGWP